MHPEAGFHLSGFQRTRTSSVHRGVADYGMRGNTKMFHGNLRGGGLNRLGRNLAFRGMNPLRTLFTAGCLLAATLASAAGFEGKVTLAITAGKGQAQVLDYSIKDSALRIDLTAEGQSFASIMDLQKMEMIMLMPQQQMYMVMPIKDKVEKAMDKAFENDASIEKTGRTETILGYKCDEYIAKDRDTITEIWVAEGLGSFMGLGSGESGGGGGGLGGLLGGGKKRGAGWEEKFKGKPGFPLRVVSREIKKQRETFKMEATKIQPGSLPASLFQAPAGWQKFSMPSMGDMLKGFGG